MTIPFIDLDAQRERIRSRIDLAISKVLDEGRFILGPEVDQLEAELGKFCGAAYVVGCGNGTDALAMPLMAWNLRPGDAVFVPNFTFAATAEAVAWLGATPVFVDIEPYTYNMDPNSLAEAIDCVKNTGGLRPRAVIAVDLFGLPADYPAISAICQENDLKLIADSAQGFGATLGGKHSSYWADVVSTSFYPAKPLGCYGDGGAVATNDAELAAKIRSLHMHGAGANQYDNVRIGLNSRIDTLQAAILLEKLKIFPDEIETRNRVASRYRDAFSGTNISSAHVAQNIVSTWAQYTIEHDNRDDLKTHLSRKNIPAVIYYPAPLSSQTAYARYPKAPQGTPVSELACSRVLSLPIHPYLDEKTQDQIIDAVHSFNG